MKLEMKYKVSVIVPIYKAEETIGDCSRSLFSQTLPEVQYIFVDDCSPDNSTNVVKSILENEFPSRADDCIFIRNETNKGSAGARLAGYRHAEGEFITACDSDDQTAPELYSTLYGKAVMENLDIVSCDYFKGRSMDNMIPVTAKDFPKDKRSMLSQLILGKYPGMLWLYIVRRELLDGNIKYPVHNVLEDLTLTVQFYWKARTFGHVAKPLYYYLINDTSLMNDKSPEKVMRRLEDEQANQGLITSFLMEQGLSECMKDEIEVEKLWIKDNSLCLIKKRSDLAIWKSIYPEINDTLFSNPLISSYKKLRCRLIKANLPIFLSRTILYFVRKYRSLIGRHD